MHSRRLSDISQSQLAAAQERHGGVGTEIAYIFRTGEVREAINAGSAVSRGLYTSDFYQVQIAPDPRNPQQLVQAGFCLRVREDLGELYYFDFYDTMWNRIGRLSANGDLHGYSGGRETLLGSYDFVGAPEKLYSPPSGYGYDSVTQDLARVRANDPVVAGGEPKSRGVAHTDHNQARPVVILTPYRAGEARALANSFDKQRFEEFEAIRLQRMRENASGASQDEGVGGVPFQRNNPVDENGKPLGPGGK
jgi:hypothetical protein